MLSEDAPGFLGAVPGDHQEGYVRTPIRVVKKLPGARGVGVCLDLDGDRCLPAAERDQEVRARVASLGRPDDVQARNLS